MGKRVEKTNLTISVDKETRDGFSRLCDDLGLTVSSCIIAMMKQAVRQQGVTFSTFDQNGFTPAEIAELKRRADDVARGHMETHDLIEG